MSSLSIGIVAKDTVDNLNTETLALYEKALEAFEEVILVNPRNVHYEFIRGVEIPNLIHNDRNLNNLDYLIVRGTRKYESSTSILVHTLHKCGCLINDPVSRFNVGFASKLLSTVTRHSNNIGSTSFFAFNTESIESLKNVIIDGNHLPLIGKPITGSKGKGVELIDSLERLVQYIAEFTQNRDNSDYPIFLQKYVNFVEEYRVFVIDKKVVGMALKNRAKGEVAANAAKGGIFQNKYNDLLKQYAESVITEMGIYGMDIAIDDENEFHVIEANRAPLWAEFTRVTKIDVAELQIENAVIRISNKNTDYQLKSGTGS